MTIFTEFILGLFLYSPGRVPESRRGPCQSARQVARRALLQSRLLCFDELLVDAVVVALGVDGGITVRACSTWLQWLPAIEPESSVERPMGGREMDFWATGPGD